MWCPDQDTSALTVRSQHLWLSVNVDQVRKLGPDHPGVLVRRLQLGLLPVADILKLIALFSLPGELPLERLHPVAQALVLQRMRLQRMRPGVASVGVGRGHGYAGAARPRRRPVPAHHAPLARGVLA